MNPEAYHKTLARQIRKYLGDNPDISPQLEQLFAIISATYTHADEDRALIERSLEISSQELTQINRQISQEVVERTKEFYREHARFIASINSLGAGFVMCDPSGEVIMINMSARYLLSPQYISEASTGGELSQVDPSSIDMQRRWTVHEIHDHLGPDAKVEDMLHEVLVAQKPIQQKNVAYCGHMLNIFFAPILNRDDANAEVLGGVMLIEDITEEKILERSKDEFFSIASHELRTPLTAIRGNTSIIKTHYADKITDPDVKAMVDDIYQSSVRLIEIVNDFLDVSRLEQGKIAYKIDPFPLDKVIQVVMYELDSLAEERGVKLVFDQSVSSDLPLVLGDQDRVKQVVYNLIGNALKFVEHGSVTVSAQQQGQFVKVMVADTGVGMTLEAQQLLFHKFQQATNSLLTRDAARGTGLGLYISRLLVEQMHGRIRLESSEPGVGSVFSFTLPVAAHA